MRLFAQGESVDVFKDSYRVSEIYFVVFAIPRSFARIPPESHQAQVYAQSVYGSSGEGLQRRLQHMRR